ncbi:UDP-N-acetyl-D-mannosaminuronic acid dehydrogenase [Pedococcus cremeus]|uniref:UDP-N-acetyl-D-mannosaminuronic acid dehydrogenase n=1 Tax=Pedococcus cremeus TaxID=587636 RepID=A0A1H9RKY8_9MICO|nr:UDP-N-acetyl-D-mannosamine dehydrogenase [Pedococcus cremeus]SER73521.1 UDP-N-acetyl-D-mannosaminuronic acid dehydrogenase [Pedococcus cremeus]
MLNTRIAVIGLGYIGLPTSAALASRGVRVMGVDVNQHFVDEINAGRVPIVEPDLDTAVAGAVAMGHLTASSEVPEADAFLIAVPTPFKGAFEPDLSYVRAATESIAPRLRGAEVVILESTSPPGTTRQISEWLAELRPDLTFPHQSATPDVNVAHCPERVLPGRIMVEMVTNDRVVGGLTRACAEKAAQIYRIFCEGEVVLTDATSAEMAKLTENSFRDVNIAFANELASVCAKVGVDVWEVIRLANHHPRVNILNPGPGVGGHCIAVDPWFIVAAAPQESRLIRTAREINDARPGGVVDAIVEASPATDAPVVACLGLAFKANIDDLRESPALTITQMLSKRLPHGTILAVEPHVDALPQPLAALDNVHLVDADVAIAKADVVALLVDHTQFHEIDRESLAGKQIVDTRGMWR